MKVAFSHPFVFGKYFPKFLTNILKRFDKNSARLQRQRIPCWNGLKRETGKSWRNGLSRQAQRLRKKKESGL